MYVCMKVYFVSMCAYMIYEYEYDDCEWFWFGIVGIGTLIFVVFAVILGMIGYFTKFLGGCLDRKKICLR